MCYSSCPPTPARFFLQSTGLPGTGVARGNAFLMEEITSHKRLVAVPVSMPVQGYSSMSGGMARVPSCFLPWSREGAEPLLLLRGAEGLTEVPTSQLCALCTYLSMWKGSVHCSPLRCNDSPKLEQEKSCRHLQTFFRDTAPGFVRPCCKAFFLFISIP